MGSDFGNSIKNERTVRYTFVLRNNFLRQYILNTASSETVARLPRAEAQGKRAWVQKPPVLRRSLYQIHRHQTAYRKKCQPIVNHSEWWNE